MALPIKPTPALSGKDAEKFFKKAKEVEEGKHKISDADYNRAMSIYRKVMKKAKEKV
ncbi:MAG: hypothetical protein HZA13_00770 [Nitrospirae bacterium]|nr:hypothetical protein [Nitrospirota bacterium]